MKNDRKCIICGARVRNQNAKTTTCDSICTLAKRLSLDRNRAAIKLAEIEEDQKDFQYGIDNTSISL